MKTKPEPGTRVRLTGEFLRNTGQQAGGEGQSKWTVKECDCRSCKCNDRQFTLIVAVDEPHEAQRKETAHLYANVPEAERPKWRHINIANLEKCK